MARSIVLGVCGVLALAGAARADGFKLDVTKDGLVVRKNGQAAILQRGATALGKVVTDASTRTIDVDVEDFTCAGSHHYKYTFGHLDARLANTAAFQLHATKQWKPAAEGFARAAALDPTWPIPAYNEASAEVERGELAAAAKALAPWLASAPVATYAQITSDPELRPLLARPEVLAIRAKQPGGVKLTGEALDGKIAFARDRGLVAVVHEEHSWGSSAFTTTLEIYELASGKLVAANDLIRWDETEPMCEQPGCGPLTKAARPRVAKRAAQVEAMLGELGFTPVKAELATPEANGDYTKYKAFFPEAKLGVVTRDGTARVLRGNKELATASVRDRFRAAIYLPEQHALALWTFHPTGEGCDGYPESVLTLVAVPAT